MGFLDKLRGRDDSTPQPDDDPDAVSGAGAGDDLDGIDAVEEIGIRRLTADEEATLESVRAGYAAHGIDPADLEQHHRRLRPRPRRPRRRRLRQRWSSCSAPRSATTWWPPAATGGWSAPTRSAPTWPWSPHAAACRW